MEVLERATQVVLERRVVYEGAPRAILRHRPETIRRRLAHLLLLPRFGLVRPYHLCQVQPLGLGLVAAGRATLGYSSLEHFLSDLEALRLSAGLADALARRYLEIWPPPAGGAFFYLDNRRKVRYSGYPTACGKISATARVLGGTTQLFLHDAAGHGLHMQSGPADTHLSHTLLSLVERFASLAGRDQVRGIIADQEMRSVALLLALDAKQYRFVTLGRTPTPGKEATLQVAGLFLPYLRDPISSAITHWVAPAQTLLQDRKRGLRFLAEVALVLDVRAGLPGRLIPVLHNQRDGFLAVEVPHQLYVGRWEGQERVFRDMRPCQNLDAHFGQKKIAVPHRRRQRQREELEKQQRSLEKQVATARQKVDHYQEQIAHLQQQAQLRQEKNQAQVEALRQTGKQATTPKQRERSLIQAERVKAKHQLQQLRSQKKSRKLTREKKQWQQTLAQRQLRCQQLTEALQALAEQPLYDFDLEKDDLMTYLRMAGENAHRFVQERYFAGSWLEKVDEATLVRLVYNQPGWIRRQGSYLHVQLQGYEDPNLQSAVAQACQRVNQAQVQLLSGHLLCMAVSVDLRRF